jgi:hypothetical protein
MSGSTKNKSIDGNNENSVNRKEKSIKGLLIDPEKHLVEEIILIPKDNNFLSDMQKYLGCRTVAVVYNAIPGVTDDLWVDDEGLLNNPEYFFLPPAPEYKENNQWLAGKALILGHDDEGDCISHSIKENQIDKLVMSIRFGRLEKKIK